MVVLEGEDFCRESLEVILFIVLVLVKVLGIVIDVWGSELLSSLVWVIVDIKFWGMDLVVRGKSWYWDFCIVCIVLLVFFIDRFLEVWFKFLRVEFGEIVCWDWVIIFWVLVGFFISFCVWLGRTYVTCWVFEVFDVDEMLKLINGESRVCEIGDLEVVVSEEVDDCGFIDVEDRDFMDVVDVILVLFILVSNCWIWLEIGLVVVMWIDGLILFFKILDKFIRFGRLICGVDRIGVLFGVDFLFNILVGRV